MPSTQIKGKFNLCSIFQSESLLLNGRRPPTVVRTLGCSTARCHRESMRALQRISVYQADSLMEFFLGASPSINQSPAPFSASTQCPCTACQLKSHDPSGPQCGDLCDISSSHSSESRSLWAAAREMTGGGSYAPAGPNWLAWRDG